MALMGNTLRLFLATVPLLASARVVSRSSTNINWGPCPPGEFNTTLPIQCGSVAVPFDYTQPDGTKFNLDIIKIPAQVQPSKGSIQFNFGGPGLPAQGDLVSLGSVLLRLSGGEYDLLAFDPRGTGKTIPFVCTEDPFYIGQILGEARSGVESDVALPRLWARGKVDGYICQHLGKGNETAEFIGTAFVARDLISVVDALGEDGMLRYWGFSYGTTLGATVAAMFPERIDKMIIDGVQNPHDYYHSNADFEEWSDTDAVFTSFFTSCIEAGPSKCALAATNKTAAALEKDTWALFDAIRVAPIAVGSTVVDLLTVKSFIAEQLKVTYGWPVVSQLLAVLLYGTDVQKQVVLAPLLDPALMGESGPIASFSIAQSLWGIHCGDRLPRLGSFDKAVPEFKKLTETSRLMGDVVAWITARCAQWPWHAKEMYKGDFKVKTKNPILVASNSFDAHTPLRSAQNVSAGFEGSGLLVVNGTGHAILNTPSECSMKAMVAYWTNGTLPPPGNVCQTARPFDQYTWTNVFKTVSNNSESGSSVSSPVLRRSLPGIL